LWYAYGVFKCVELALEGILLPRAYITESDQLLRHYAKIFLLDPCLATSVFIPIYLYGQYIHHGWSNGMLHPTFWQLFGTELLKEATVLLVLPAGILAWRFEKLRRRPTVSMFFIVWLGGFSGALAYILFKLLPTRPKHKPAAM